MSISQTMECEGIASSIFSAAKLSRYLEGESEWTIPVMPKWARSSSPSDRAIHDIRKMIRTLEDDFYNVDETEDEETKRTMARLKEAAQQLSPPRFGADYKLQKKARFQEKKPITTSRSIPQVFKLLPGSSNWSVSEDITVSSQIQQSHVNSATKADTSVMTKGHLHNAQQRLNEPEYQAPIKTATILEQGLKEVDGVEYCIRRNGKVFWYYENGPVFEPVTQEEFQRFEVVHPAQRFPYHNDYYLIQMYGRVPCESPPYLMPLYLGSWDGSDECQAIQWAEWARYHHKMALNEEMRQAAIQTAYYEGSLLWGPHWERGFVPIGWHQNIAQVQTEDQHRTDRDAGAQEILAMIHKTPESSPVKTYQSAIKPSIERETQTPPQGDANKNDSNTSPLQSCLKSRAGSNSSGSSSRKSVRFADEAFLLGLLHRGGCKSASDQEEDVFDGHDEETEECLPDTSTSCTEMQNPESAVPKQTGLMSPAIIHQSPIQLRENDISESVAKKSANVQNDDNSKVGVKDANSEESVANVNNRHIVGALIQTNEDVQGADPQSNKKNGTPERIRQEKVVETKNLDLSAAMAISTPVKVSTRPPVKIKERSTKAANESKASEPAIEGNSKALYDAVNGSKSSKKVWSNIVASPPNSTRASQNSPDVSPTGWKTCRKAPKAPALNWAEEVEEVVAEPAPATPARTSPPVGRSPASPLLQGGRAAAEALNTDMGWTQPQPEPAARASVVPPAPLAAAAPAPAGRRPDNSGASRRGGSGGEHPGQGRGGDRRSDHVPAGSSVGRREAGLVAGSGADGEKAEGDIGRDGGGGKREMPRWMKLRKERTWRGQG
ncbi:hypothetical protein QBC40DRAFT_319663 [Triangularia verruculosa]|uniref:Uncharacterized protein n=1 Tax=Triangularia verruculosa TaxID=2587418 RepID=A0AAN6XM92_9PEZI|nr:hypothetical protein QBC40DRAFT_319663 [Triangularia verruculosa]